MKASMSKSIGGTSRLAVFFAWVFIVSLFSFGSTAISTEPGEAKKPFLSKAETEWLSTHPEITLAPDPGYPPIEYFDENGQYRGIAADYVRLVESKLGMRFKIVRLRDWDEALEKAKRKEIDMFGAAAETPQRSNYMLFSSPFVEFPSVIIARRNVTAPLSLEKLAGMRVAIVSGYADHDYVVNHFPDLNLDVVPSVEIGLRKVSFGMVDALVANLASATYFIEKQGITNLRLAGNTGYLYRLGFGSRRDWPELAGILEKALNDIRPEEREAIFKKWVRLEQESLVAKREFWISLFLVLGVASLIVFGMFLWNHALRTLVSRRTDELFKELSERTRAEEELKNYREHLEELVRQRTLGLAHANELLLQEINERKQTEQALTESEGKLRFLSSQLLKTQEEERKRIARELHDSIGQSLAAIKFKVENVMGEIDSAQSAGTAHSLELVIPVVQNAMEEARRIYTGLRPSVLDDLGIIATIGWFCREFQKTYHRICIEQQIDIDEEEIPEPLKIVIFRIVQEALNNVARHSRAELVSLSLGRKDGLVRLDIEDNGTGFDPRSALTESIHEKGLGIAGMKERTELSGGAFRLISVLDTGTTIHASWPLTV
jgi:signal transduction histidine kinase/ABC-type amino acid transport substrate-binding protein